MLLDYVPQQRDDFEAASARFPGETTDPRAAGSPARARVLGVLSLAVLALTAALLLRPRRPAADPSPIDQLLVEADHVNHHVFVIGLVTAAVGGAMVVVPLAYALALRRSSRPLTHYPVRVELGDDGVTLRTPTNELAIAWAGVVAFAETRHLFVLKTVSDLRVALPKRAAEPDALRTLLHARILPLAEAAVAPRLAA